MSVYLDGGKNWHPSEIFRMTEMKLHSQRKQIPFFKVLCWYLCEEGIDTFEVSTFLRPQQKIRVFNNNWKFRAKAQKQTWSMTSEHICLWENIWNNNKHAKAPALHGYIIQSTLWYWLFACLPVKTGWNLYTLLSWVTKALPELTFRSHSSACKCIVPCRSSLHNHCLSHNCCGES